MTAGARQRRRCSVDAAGARRCPSASSRCHWHSVDVAGAQHYRPVQLSHRQRSGVSVPPTPKNVRLSPVSERLTSAVDRRLQGKRRSPCHRCTFFLSTSTRPIRSVCNTGSICRCKPISGLIYYRLSAVWRPGQQTSQHSMPHHQTVSK